jgi:hypothetical protein
MTAFTKPSIAAAAAVLVLAMLVPGVGQAQSSQTKVQSAAVTSPNPVQRPAQATVKKRVGAQACAGHAWWGCTGGDPDPSVRGMLARDIGGDD